MAKRKSLDELEILSPKELGKILLKETQMDSLDLEYVKDLVAAGAILDVKSEDGRTVLHHVIAYNLSEPVILFLEKGVDPNIKDDIGWTPLHYLVNYGHRNIIQLFLTSGADINALDVNGIPPLFYCVMGGYYKLTKFLLDSGASKFIEDESNMTAWDFADEVIREKVPELNPDYND